MTLLALVAAGQVEIDVGPLAALFREEALEEQVHADGIDGGDAERIADGAVGGGTATLHENAVVTAEADDVPHDEEVAFEVELLDEGEFALDLAMRAFAEVSFAGMAVALACAFVGALAQEGHHGLAFGHGIARELVAEIGEREFESRGKFAACWRSPREGRRRGATFRRASSMWRSELVQSRRPAVASVRWLRMQVKTSSTWRCSGCA